MYKISKATNNQLDWLKTTMLFFKAHLPVIMSLGLVAGIGRVIQLGGFGAISGTVYLVLEVIIETARLLLVIYVVGSASIPVGISRIGKIFSRDSNRRQLAKRAVSSIRSKWKSLLMNFVLYLVIAWLINVFIDHIAYETCLYLTMRQHGILNDQTSEWTIILFFKNLTIIPLTLIFNTLFLFHVTNKMRLAKR
jgi:hypothetical protein